MDTLHGILTLELDGKLVASFKGIKVDPTREWRVFTAFTSLEPHLDHLPGDQFFSALQDWSIRV